MLGILIRERHAHARHDHQNRNQQSKNLLHVLHVFSYILSY
jgi:hypothetical protein